MTKKAELRRRIARLELEARTKPPTFHTFTVYIGPQENGTSAVSFPVIPGKEPYFDLAAIGYRVTKVAPA